MNIELLKPYKRELTGFLKYVKSQTNLDVFLKLDFKYQLGWYFDYFAKNNVTIVVNRVSYRIYFAGSKLVRRKYHNELEPIEIWKLAIIDSFNYLEQPF